MTKHVYFWLGVFVTFIVAVPAIFFIWDLTGDKALDIVALAFGAIVGSIAILLIVMLLRGWLLRKLGAGIEGTINNVASSAGHIIAAAVTGDRDAVTHQGRRLAHELIAWYSWNSFYRWVISTCISLLIAIAAFSGTVLLFDQNRKIGEQTEKMEVQNELMTLPVLADLRETLMSETKHSRTFPRKFETNSCMLSAHVEAIYPQPRRSDISAIKRLGDNPQLKKIVISSLIALLDDPNPTVAYGALLVLDQWDAIPEVHRNFLVENISIAESSVKSDIALKFNNSYIQQFSCDTCSVELTASVAEEVDVRELKIGISFVANYEADKVDFSNSLLMPGGELYTDENDEEYENEDIIKSSKSNLIGGVKKEHVENIFDFSVPLPILKLTDEMNLPNASCDDLELLCRHGPFKCQKDGQQFPN